MYVEMTASRDGTHLGAGHDEHFPKTPVENKLHKLDGFCVAASGFDVPRVQLLRPGTTSKVTHWVDLIVLLTAKSLIHGAFPDTVQWTVSSEEDHHHDVDGPLFRQVHVLNTNSEATPEHYNSNINPMVVFVQPAWVLSPKDFETLVTRRKVRDRAGG